MKADKLKIVWICGFSNKQVFERLNPKYNIIERWVRGITKRATECEFREISVWITNGIREFEKFSDDIELHIVAPFSNIGRELVEFEENGVCYHFVNSEFNFLRNTIKRQFLKKSEFSEFKHNRKIYKRIIGNIKPDLVHLIGAECPNYSLALLDIPYGIPKLVHLQTLMSDPDFESSYCISHESYVYRSEVERNVLLHANYIATIKRKYTVDLLRNVVKVSVPLLNLSLALVEPINLGNQEKEFDFVYFSKEVEKAGDWAIEAFILTYKKNPKVTMIIVGACSESFKMMLIQRLKSVRAENNVFFLGSQPTHDDVIKLIRKSRFAVLPMKIDMICSTIRESMANGIPVVTTITPASPDLNKDRKSVLLSEKKDFQAMADNMCLLLEDKQLCLELKTNAAVTISEKGSNYDIMTKWKNAYFSIVNNVNNNIPIPEDLLILE